MARGCTICKGREDTRWGKELQVLPECNHTFCLPCLSVAWHHAPSGGQCPLCLTELDQTGSRKIMLDSIPLLSRGSNAKSREQRAKVLDGAIAELGDLIEGKEASAETCSLYANYASLMEVRDKLRQTYPSDDLVQAWLTACLCPGAEGTTVETCNWLGYGTALFGKGDKEASTTALDRARECADRSYDMFNRRVVNIYLSRATLLKDDGSHIGDDNMVKEKIDKAAKHVEEMNEAANMLEDAYEGFESDPIFCAHGLDFAKACADYAEKAMLSERGSLQLTTAVDNNLNRWIDAPLCDNSSTLQHTYGKALRRLGRIDGAVHHLWRSTQIDPNSAENWGNFGIALRQKGDLQSAAEAQRKAISLDPKSGTGVFNLGNVLLELNELHLALESMNEAERLGVPPQRLLLVQKFQAAIYEALQCKACDQPLAHLSCSGCESAFYCDTQCQKKGQKKHKKACKKLRSRPTNYPPFMAPWKILLYDSRGTCELQNEDGSPVRSKEVRKGQSPKVIMEIFGERIRRVERVDRIESKKKGLFSF